MSLLTKTTLFHGVYILMWVEIIRWNRWFLYCFCVKKLQWMRTKTLRTNLGCICTKSYFGLNKNLNYLWVSLILTHISTQTFCVWSIDSWVNVVRRHERKYQCPKQFGLHWTKARLSKARCYSLVDKKFLKANLIVEKAKIAYLVALLHNCGNWALILYIYH